VAGLAFLLEPHVASSFVVGLSIMLGITGACLAGLMIPWLLKFLKVEPRIAGGPLVLALTDVSTILIYLGLATAFLGA